MVPPVTIYSLEMHAVSELKRARRHPDLQIIECEIRQFEVNRFLYSFVGGPWQWIDKLRWSDAQWQAYAENPKLRTWIAYSKGSPAGYFELLQQTGGNVEIAYFGLAPRFIGQGLGGDLLTRSIETAWNWGARRVWVHTCTLDHASALPNYQARGFKLFKEEING